jgi:hypothetical protein
MHVFVRIEITQLARSCTSPVPCTLECYNICHLSAPESRVVPSDSDQLPTRMPSKIMRTIDNVAALARIDLEHQTARQ